MSQYASLSRNGKQSSSTVSSLNVKSGNGKTQKPKLSIWDSKPSKPKDLLFGNEFLDDFEDDIEEEVAPTSPAIAVIEDVVFVQPKRKPVPPKPVYVQQKVGTAPLFKPELQVAAPKKVSGMKMKPKFINAQDKIEHNYEVWIKEILETYAFAYTDIEVPEDQRASFIEQFNKAKGQDHSLLRPKHPVLKRALIAKRRLLHDLNMPRPGVMYNNCRDALIQSELLLTSFLNKKTENKAFNLIDDFPALQPSGGKTTKPVWKNEKDIIDAQSGMIPRSLHRPVKIPPPIPENKPRIVPTHVPGLPPSLNYITDGVRVPKARDQKDNVAQMFSMFSTPSRLNETLTSVKDASDTFTATVPLVVPTLNQTCQKVDNLCQQATSSIAQLHNEIEMFKQRFQEQHGEVAVAVVSKLCGLVVALYACYQTDNVQQRMLIMSSNVLCLNLPGAIFKLLDLYPQASAHRDHNVAQMLEFLDMSETRSILHDTILNILGIKALDVPHLFQNASKISANVRGTRDIFTLLFETLDSVYRHLRYGPHESLVKSIEEWITKAHDLKSLLAGDIMMDSGKVKALKELLDQYLILRTKICEVKATNSCSQVLLSLNHSMEEFYAMLRQANTVRESRIQPIWLYFIGPSNVGKSFLIKYLEEALYAKCLAKNKDDTFNEAMTYPRNFNDQYWSGYHNQPFVTIDDQLQVQTSQQVNLYINEMFAIVNTQPYQLNMADVTSKGNTYMTSSFVFETENVELLPECNNIANSQAYYRRQTFRVLVGMKSKYGELKAGSKQGICNAVFVQNKELIQREISDGVISPWDVYEFDVINPLTREVVASKIDFSELVERVATAYEAGLRDKSLRAMSATKKFSRFADEIPDETVEMFSQSLDDIAHKYPSIREYVTSTVSDVVDGVSSVYVNVSRWARAEAIKAQSKPDSKDLGNTLLRGGIFNVAMPGKAAINRWTATIGYVTRSFTYKKVVSADGSIEVTEANVQPFGKISEYLRRAKGKLEEFWTLAKEHKLLIAALGGVISLFGAVKMMNLLLAPVLSTESTVSGDPKTKGIPKKHMMMPKTGKPKPVKMIGKNDAQALDTQAADLMCTVFARNMYHLRCMGPNGVNTSSIAVFLAGRSFQTVRHSTCLCTEDGNITFTEFHFSNIWHSFKVKVDKLNFHEVNDIDDLIVIEITDLTVPMHKDITNHIAANETVLKTSFSQVALLSIHNNVPTIKIGNCKKDVSNIEYRFNMAGYEETLCANNVFSVDIESVAGECGGIYIALSPSMQTKIIGQHIAGNPSRSKGYGVLIGPVKQFFSTTPQAIELKFESSRLEDTGIAPIPGILPTSSSIVPSPLQEVIIESGFPLLTSPAILKPTEGVSPLEKALKKFAGPLDIDLSPEDQELLTECATSVAKQIGCAYKLEGSGHLRVDQAINGVVGWDNFSKLFMTTSPGIMVSNPLADVKQPREGKWTYITCATCEGKCKTGTHDLELLPEFKVYFEKFLEVLKDDSLKGEEMWETFPTYFKDCLKDERVTLEKVRDKKTRLFSASPLHLLLAKRMYYAPLIQNMMVDPVNSISAMGINPSGPQWGQLYNRFVKPGAPEVPRQYPGDFKFFDGSHLPKLVQAAIHAEVTWFKLHGFIKTEEDQRVIENLAYITYNSHHIVSNGSYIIRGSNPSGDFCTTAHNIIVNAIAHCFSAVKEARRLGVKGMYGIYSPADYWKQFVFSAFGDDHLEATFVTWYTMQAKKIQLAALGLGYTNPDKSEINETSPAFYTPEMLIYLKRRFVVEPNTKYVFAPLEYENIVEILKWQRNKNATMEDFVQTIQNAVLEAAHHGRAKYYDFCNRVDVWLAQSNMPFVDWISYEAVIVGFQGGKYYLQ